MAKYIIFSLGEINFIGLTTAETKKNFYLEFLEIFKNISKRKKCEKVKKCCLTRNAFKKVEKKF